MKIFLFIACLLLPLRMILSSIGLKQSAKKADPEKKGSSGLLHRNIGLVMLIVSATIMALCYQVHSAAYAIMAIALILAQTILSRILLFQFVGRES